MGIPILTALTSTHITNTTTHSISYLLEKKCDHDVTKFAQNCIWQTQTWNRSRFLHILNVSIMINKSFHEAIYKESFFTF
jgi:hypothetical protein